VLWTGRSRWGNTASDRNLVVDPQQPEHLVMALVDVATQQARPAAATIHNSGGIDRFEWQAIAQTSVFCSA
jgi:hypothetical protein